MLEIHAVDPCHRGGHRQDGGPGGELAGDPGLLRLSCHQARLEREGQHLAQGLDLLLHPPDVVRDVAEERLHRGIDPGQPRLLEAPADLHERDGRIAQAQEIAAELVEPPHMHWPAASARMPSSISSTSSWIVSITGM